MSNPYREEIIAKLLADYRQEIEAFTDEELRHHIETMRRVHALDTDDWRELARQFLSVDRK